MRSSSRCSIVFVSAWLSLLGCGGVSVDPFVGGSSPPLSSSGDNVGAAGTASCAGGASSSVSSVGLSSGGVNRAGGNGGAPAFGGDGANSGTAGGGGEVMSGGQPTDSSAAGMGNGAAGGVAVDPGSACYGKTAVPPALLADAENGTEGWFGYIGDGAVGVLQTHPGAENSPSAIEFDGGRADSSGMGLGLFCDDVSGFGGVSFWAKGRGGDHLRFQVAIPGTDAKPGRGDCNPDLVKCNDHPGMALVLTHDWVKYTVTWDELKQYGWGQPAQFMGIANSLLWINDGPVDSFDFEIDDVRLVAKD